MNVKMRRVHIRGFTLNTVLRRYRDCSSRANTMFVLRRPYVRAHSVNKC